MKAIITGITGQCGSYMLDYLLSKNYEVLGVKRRSSTDNNWRIKHNLCNPNFKLVEGDILDSWSIYQLIKDYNPDYIFHYACQSHVGTSFCEPKHTIDTILIGTLNILEAIKNTNQKIKMYNSSSSEMFGQNIDSDKYQRETTPFNPQSPYAVGKVAAHSLCKLYREAYNIYVVNGITFNMESPRRGENFVTRKITKYVANLRKFKNSRDGVFGHYPKLKLGNLYSSRDWQYCGDAIQGMYKMLQQENPKDYVLATGNTYTIEDFLDEAFTYIGQDMNNFIEIDSSLIRPAEVDVLRGDSSLAKRELDWTPSVGLSELVKLMIDEEPTVEKQSICLKTDFCHPDHLARMKMLSKCNA